MKQTKKQKLEKKKLTKKYKLKLEKRELRKKDKEWSNQIKEIFNNQCLVCKKNKGLNSHHIIPREIKEFRHDLLNGLCLCPQHHKWDNYISAHKNPFVLYEFYKQEMPERYQQLVNKLINYRKGK